jgi:deoxyribodipyrimidine photolyase-related protein
MEKVSLVFPHQLFEDNPVLVPGAAVFLVEEYLFFRQYTFHKQKLVLHRASMKAYQQSEALAGFTTEYIQAFDERADVRNLIAWLKSQGTKQLFYCDVVDDWLGRRIEETAAAQDIKTTKVESPNFICTEAYVREYFAKSKRFYLTKFYTDQRERLNIMLDNGKPLGGQWTYDVENRSKMPQGTYVPPIPVAKPNAFVTEAIAYVDTHFADNFGVAKAFNYPITHAESRQWFGLFLKERFANYGIYQDAIVKGETTLFHAVITPMLNIGLLNPAEVVDEAMNSANEHGVPLNSLEGFIRQVLGWREYIRAVYILKGRSQRTHNYWKHDRDIPAVFYTENTGIAPIDDCIVKLKYSAYNHHIERLMVLGNYMCLCGFKPDAIYQWFMELYIDAYDWVMVPNVYGMSQYADGGLMSTKPYISSSNYIAKMSHYKPAGNEKWMKVWDGLYWRFIANHSEFFGRNPRMAVMVKQLDKMGPKLPEHIRVAEEYLERIGGK